MQEFTLDTLLEESYNLFNILNGAVAADVEDYAKLFLKRITEVVSFCVGKGYNKVVVIELTMQVLENQDDEVLLKAIEKMLEGK